MKSKQSDRALLGITQYEMARLLAISEGQYSMYESGKRKLPEEASRMLQDVLIYMNAPTTAKARLQTKAGVKQQAEVWKQLKNMFEVNKSQLESIELKIKKLVQKLEGNLKALQLTEFVQANPKVQNVLTSGTLQTIESRAVNELAKNGKELTRLQAKEQGLLAQQVWIKKQLDAKNP